MDIIQARVSLFLPYLQRTFTSLHASHSSPMIIRKCFLPDHARTHTYPTSRSLIQRPRPSHHNRCCLTHPPPPQHTPATFHAIRTRLDHTHTTPPSQPTHLVSRCCNAGIFFTAVAIFAAPATPIELELQPHAAVKRRQHKLQVIAQAPITRPSASWPEEPRSRIFTDYYRPQWCALGSGSSCSSTGASLRCWD